MQAHHNEKMSKIVYPQPILCVASKFVTLPQSDSSVKKKKEWIIELKSANCFLETEKMLYYTQ